MCELGLRSARQRFELTTLGFLTSSGLYHLDALSDLAGTFRSPPANFFVWVCGFVLVYRFSRWMWHS